MRFFLLIVFFFVDNQLLHLSYSALFVFYKALFCMVLDFFGIVALYSTYIRARILSLNAIVCRCCKSKLLSAPFIDFESCFTYVFIINLAYRSQISLGELRREN